MELIGILDKIKRTNQILGYLFEDEFNLTDDNYEELYKTFQQTYLKSTGHSWSIGKFYSRAKNWKFFGDYSGFVTVRVQKSGYWKITGSAGSSKGILKGLDELLSKDVPLWTAASDDIVSMLKKKNFIVFKGLSYGIAMKTLSKTIDKSVFGDEIENVDFDGGLIFNVDGKKFKKYFACNKKYIKELVSKKDIPEVVKNIFTSFL